MNAFCRFTAGQSCRDAAVHRDAPVEGRRQLEMNERPLILMPADKLFIQLCRLVSQHAGNDLDTGGSQRLKTASRNEWVWIVDRANHPFNAGADEGPGTRRCFAVVVVRFERDIGGAAAS